jgi:hypothetical protein
MRVYTLRSSSLFLTFSKGIVIVGSWEKHQRTNRNINNFMNFPDFYKQTNKTANNDDGIGFIIPNVKQNNH